MEELIPTIGAIMPAEPVESENHIRPRQGANQSADERGVERPSEPRQTW